MAVPALAAGVGLALSLPPWGFWVLAPPAAAVLWWRLGGLRWPQRLLAGWLAGLGLFVPGLWWALSFNVYGGLILMVVEALALALACAASPPGRGRGPVLAGAMVLTEALRSAWPFGGLPLGGIALGQAGGPLAGAARLGGPLLLVGIVWLAGAGLGTLVDALARLARHRSALRRHLRGRGALPAHEHPSPGPFVARQVTAGITALVVVGALALSGAAGPRRRGCGGAACGWPPSRAGASGVCASRR